MAAAAPPSGRRMTNAERILRELDSHLDHEVRLVLYGRAAIAIGFANMVIPDIVELRDAFERAKPVVLKIARTANTS
jgi:hypothetical protein